MYAIRTTTIATKTAPTLDHILGSNDNNDDDDDSNSNNSCSNNNVDLKISLKQNNMKVLPY